MPAPVISGRRLALLMLGVTVAVVAIFAGLSLFHLDRIRTSVAVRRSEKPVLKLPSGEMVIVPAGEFQVPPGQAAPPLAPFYIDKSPVTQPAYAAFLRENGRAVQPVSAASSEDARAFCEWTGKRLPTPEELAKAARGASTDDDVSIYGALRLAAGTGFRCAKAEREVQKGK
ncbi:MAG: SUMF1/EgtB/PvdO family nonheme iron enzyme [Candidatus Solibacter usitatus]|nr:SUMF1/EgtB/PvdO family nonheme iron enzyme [Candidatus Solibacter usitatus]